ncbi:tyrosinase cofactor [Streptomyces bambusae]|uniref:tyrosinase cofactor n=1 Tax=Streptomyces bambusae TaxID=1550616 RepID=UPI001CFD2DC8|nr:tyrosinase cofactor [Streptomyces bambusae]MCB5164216.1 tyrosinase cofactor [Streptomyces bambusae]
MRPYPTRCNPRTAAAVLTRRAVLRTVFTAGVVSATAAALAPVFRSRRTVAPAATPGPRPAPLFEETYRGRHISAAPAADGSRGGLDVRIDGRPLHVMRRADGSYLSGVNHFESFDSPLDLARAAVDELGSVRLAAAPAHHG